MATKKTDLDPTIQKQAVTQDDVNEQDARTRLWQSLNYTYGNQKEESDKQFRQAYIQADLQALSRGMQRSSYNLANLANIQQKGIEAGNKIGQALIADYQNRLTDLEKQEKEDEWREREFAANREDAAWNKEYQTNAFEYQKERDTVADQQWQKQYDESLRQFNEQMAYQRERANVSDAQWQKEYDEKLREFNDQMAEQKRQFDLNYNENVRQFNVQTAPTVTSDSGRYTPSTNPGTTTETGDESKTWWDLIMEKAILNSKKDEKKDIWAGYTGPRAGE